MTSRRLSTAWNDSAIDSFADIVQSVGFQGVNDLLLKPANEHEEMTRAFLQKKGLPWSEADEVCNYFYALAMEAVELAVLIGYSLGQTPQGLGSLDRWLQEAMARAGVARYEPRAETWAPLAETIEKAAEA